MPVYVVVDIEITDPEVYEEVKRRTPATVAAYGGKYLARGGQTRVLAGDWNPSRLAVLQFDSLEQAQAWQDSPEYQPVKALRERSARVNMVAIEAATSADFLPGNA
jgi:uncharacterized protein (DUF1330 family)